MVIHWNRLPGCGCPIPEAIQGWAGCDSEQPGLVVGDPAHSRGLKLDIIVVLFNPGLSMIMEENRSKSACG